MSLVSRRPEPDLVDGFIAGVLQPQVDHGVLQRPAHVELQGQIVHPLYVGGWRGSHTFVFLIKAKIGLDSNTDDVIGCNVQNVHRRTEQHK